MDVTQEMKILKEEKASVDKALIEAQKGIEIMSSELDNVKKSLGEQHSAQLEKCFEEIQTLKHGKGQLEVQMSGLKGEIEQMLSIHTEEKILLERERDGLKGDLASLKRSYQESKTELDKLQQNIKSIEHSNALKLNEMNLKNMALESNLTLLTNEKLALSNDYDQLKKKYNDLTITNENLVNQNDKLKQNLEDSSFDLKKMQALLGERDLNIKQLNERSGQLQSLNAELKQTLDRKEQEIDQLKLSVNKLEVSLDTKEKELQDLLLKASNQHSVFEAFQNQIAVLEQKTEKAETEYTSLVNQLNISNEQILSANAENRLQSERIADLTQQLTLFKSQLQSEHEVDSLKTEEIQTLSEQLEALKSENESLKQSLRNTFNDSQVKLSEEKASLLKELHQLKSTTRLVEQERDELLAKLSSKQQELVALEMDKLNELNVKQNIIQTTENELKSLHSKIEILNDSNAKMLKELTKSNLNQSSVSSESSHLQGKIRSLQEIVQKLSDEKISLELMLDDSKQQFVHLKAILINAFPGHSFESEESVAGELSTALSSVHQSSEQSLKTLFIHLEQTLLQMYNKIPRVPRIISVPSLLQDASMGDLQKYLYAFVDELGISLRTSFVELNERITQLESSMHQDEIEHQKALKEKSMIVAACNQKLEKYRKVLKRKEHFIEQAMKHIEAIGGAFPAHSILGDHEPSIILAAHELPTF